MDTRVGKRIRTMTRKKKAFISLVVLSGAALLSTLSAYIWAALTQRLIIETSTRSAFELCTIVFTVLLGVLLATPDQ
jgi:ABC-type multidrug transport system fused ATPase/permease subunit